MQAFTGGGLSSPLFLKRKYLPLDLLQMEQDEEEGVQEVRLTEREPNPKWSLFPKITTVLH